MVPAFRRSAIGGYFAVWALVLPVTSVVLLPSVPGTTPGFLLALGAPLVALTFCPGRVGGIVRTLGLLVGALAVLLSASQLGLMLHPRLDVSHLSRVNALDAYLLPLSLVTQSLYLLVGFCTFAFVRTLYRRSWDRYILAGAALLAVYGLYEFVFFLLTGRSGDILSNRVFFDGVTARAGSFFQVFTVGGFKLMRIKSLTGEPSMYAFTMLPFWIYALHLRSRLHWLFLGTLVLTTSTTAFLGIALYLGLRTLYLRLPLRLLSGRLDKLLLLVMILGALVLAFAAPFVQAFVQEMIVDKLTAGNVSGAHRSSAFFTHFSFFWEAPLFVKLFGIGFGYVRSTDFFSTLLVNTGLTGFLLFAGLFLYPVFRLGRDYRSLGLKMALLVVFVTMMVAVPEFSYLSSWLFLGVAYHALGKGRRPA